MMILYNDAMEFKMTRTSVGPSDGSQEESDIALICLV